MNTYTILLLIASLMNPMCMASYKIKTTVLPREKVLIDHWLEENNLNDTGDSLDTMYTGGTPLFDETTGISIDRYSYLANKFPHAPWKTIHKKQRPTSHYRP